VKAHTTLRRLAHTFLLATQACAVEPPPDLAGVIRKEAAALASEAERRGAITIGGRDGWLFFAPELRHVGAGPFWGPDAARVSRARQADWADPLPAILDFKRQLHDAGVELLLVPVPPKCIVYADMLPWTVSVPTPPPRLDPAHQSLYELLRSQGVTVVDLTEPFLANRSHPEGPLYCRQDTHWSGTGCVLAAQAIADLVRRRPWIADIERQEFRREWYSTTIQGDLWRALQDGALPPEELRLRRILRDAAGGSASIEPEPSSPVVLLGDSHNLVFQGGDDMHARGSGLADQLALELGFPVELVGVRGSGATPARVNLLRRAQRDPDYWKRKRLVIWCFAAREFTESDGWSLVPIAP
jgi:alginate O-acetyltransferase complex protein AlgJ